jgi:WD40 repeat protein
VNDSQRFLLEHFDKIQNSPSQIYHYALPFSPPSSWLCKYYVAELSGVVKVVNGHPAGWGACSRTVILDSNPAVLACRKDTIAVGLGPSNIIILNAITGSQVAVLSGHAGRVISLTFSLDGALLLSGSEAVELWDVQTGGVVKTFHGHSRPVGSVSISADCTMIASGSGDGTICLWDIQSGGCHWVIRQDTGVNYVAFSPAGSQLISASSEAVKRWDIDGHLVGPTHRGFLLELSQDGAHFALWSNNDVVTIQNVESGATVAKCPMPIPCSTSIHSSFSPNGSLVAVSNYDTAYIWDITHSTPLLINTFIGHIGAITSLTFSSPSTLISASNDKSVKFWQIGGLSADPVANDTKPTQPISTPIRSVSLQAENGVVISIDQDGVVRVWDISTGICKTSIQTPAKDINCGEMTDAQMIDRRLIFVWLGKEGINIWDTKEGKPQMIKVSWDISCGLRISGDGSKVFLLTGGFIQAWSMQTRTAAGKVWVEDMPSPASDRVKTPSCYLDPLRVDGSRIWVHFMDRSTQGWDFGVSGSSPVTLPNTPSEKPHLCFICDISQWGISQSRIEDTVTGEEVFQLCGEYEKPVDVQWDRQYLVAGYESGKVLILDFKHLCPG